LINLEVKHKLILKANLEAKPIEAKPILSSSLLIYYFISDINVRKSIQNLFKYHYETIMHFIKFIVSCIPSFKNFCVKQYGINKF
jgi:hypothetical protein